MQPLGYKSTEAKPKICAECLHFKYGGISCRRCPNLLRRLAEIAIIKAAQTTEVRAL